MKKENSMRGEVKQVAREAKKEIRQESRAAKRELNDEYKEFKTSAKASSLLDDEDIRTVREARDFVRKDIFRERREGLDSIDELRDEYLEGTASSGQEIMQEIEDVVGETEYEMNKDIY